MNPDLIVLKATVLEAARRTKLSRIEIKAYSGGVLHIDGRGAVLIDLSGMELPGSVPLLADHQNNLESLIGSGEAVVRQGQLFVMGTLAQTDSAKQVIALSRAADLQASVGVQVVESRFVREGEQVTANGRTHTAEADGLTFVSKSILREVSILPLGADANTEVSIAAKAVKGVEMGKEDHKDDDGFTQNERDRVVRVMELTSEHPKIQAKAIAEGWDAAKVELEVLRAQKEKAELTALRATRPANIGGPQSFSTDEQPPADVLTAAVLTHAGRSEIAKKHVGERAVEQAKGLRARSLLDICAASLSLRGIDPPVGKTELIRASFSTLDMPTALGNSASMIALDVYRESPATWRQFARIRSVSDFKDLTLVRMVSGGEYEKVAPGGEIKHGTLGEETSTVKATTRGKMLRIDRTNIINDDLNLFADTAAALGRAGARAVADEVFSILLANKESDATDFFHADNSNLLTGGGSALDFDSLQSALESMVKMTDAKGRTLDLRPELILVPPELEVAARQLVSSPTVARYTTSGTDQVPEGNPFSGLKIAIEPRLSNSAFTGYSTTAWYAFTRPSDGAVTVVFLDGRDAPIIEQVDAGPDVLGVVFRGYHDFGAVLSDPRAALKANGA